ncbi:GntR family transcriptional regulator [Micromonospora violae]|uniref:GntR family transcriptional regulator n=1 Tax=Micromonospora violae TaxID=1278207 RepID=UPI00102C088D
MISHYGVSAEPVRSALLILQAEGLIEGHQGRATKARARTWPRSRSRRESAPGGAGFIQDLSR